jgi:hypothetical protein
VWPFILIAYVIRNNMTNWSCYSCAVPTKRSGFFENPVYHQQEFVIAIGKKPEKFQGVAETVAHPLKAPVKGFFGGPFSPFREDFKKIAAPEAESPIEMGAVFHDPLFPPADPPAHQQQGRGSLADRFKEGCFFRPFEGPGIAAHHPEAGEGLADVFFGFLQNPQFSPQKIGGKFPALQNREEVDHKVKGHIPDGGFAGQKADAPDKTPGNGDHEAGVENKGTVLSAPPGPEEVPEGKKHDIPAISRGQELINGFGKMVLGYDVYRNF